MQLKDVTPIIKAILEERDKIPIIHNMERYIPNWTPWHAGNFMRGGIRKALRIIEQAPVVDAVEVVHARWVLEESPYAEHEEAVDGESHPRYVCSNCHQEAGFTCDPDGFAGYQDLTTWCGGCGAKMDGGAEA